MTAVSPGAGTSHRRRLVLPLAAGLVLLLVAALVAWLVTRGDDRPGAEPGWVLQGVAGEGETSQVRVPWGVLDVSVGEPRQEIPGSSVAAPESGSLVWVGIEPTEQLLPMPMTPDGRIESPTLSVVADGRTYPLTQLTTRNLGGNVVLQQTSAWVALGTQPDEVSVVVSYDGRDQTIRPDGSVEAGAFAALDDVALEYDARRCGQARVSPGYTVTTRYGRQGRPRCSLTWLEQVPYVAGLGWAEEGRTWLVATVTSDPPYGVVRDGDAQDDSRNLDSEHNRWRFTFDGRPADLVVALNQLPFSRLQDPDDPRQGVFDVPAGTTEGTLTVTRTAPVNSSPPESPGSPVAFLWSLSVVEA